MGHYSYEHLEIQDGGQPPSQMKKIAASQHLADRDQRVNNTSTPNRYKLFDHHEFWHDDAK